MNSGGHGVCLVKKYKKPWSARHLKWEYVGTFTARRIVGEWHYLGDPPELAFHRVRSGIWLKRDEDATGDALDSQIRTMTRNGKILSRPLTFTEGYPSAVAQK